MDKNLLEIISITLRNRGYVHPLSKIARKRAATEIAEDAASVLSGKMNKAGLLDVLSESIHRWERRNTMFTKRMIDA